MSRKTPTPKTFSVLPIIYARKKSGKPKNRNKTKNNQPKIDKRLKLYLSLNLSKNIKVYYTKQERRTTILMAKNLEFDNEMKNLSMCVYKGVFYIPFIKLKRPCARLYKPKVKYKTKPKSKNPMNSIEKIQPNIKNIL